MQHNMMRQPATPFGAETAGDVLASIRRLIAQDEAGCRLQNAVADDAIATPAALHDMAEAPAQQTAPLILDSSDLVASEAQAASAEADDTPAPTIPDRDASPWLRFDTVEPLSPSLTPFDAEPAGIRETLAELLFSDTAEAVTETITSGPLNEEPSTTTVQMEETMLHANASVTPINPAGEAPPREGAEMHLFAPEEKGAQKGNHLRGMIREAIRQELQGEIGNRLSRNLQAMIRQEIEVTLRQMCEEN